MHVLENQNKTDLVDALYLCTGELAPSYLGMQMHFRYKTFLPALERITKNSTLHDLQALYTTHGDIGHVMQSLLSSGQISLKEDEIKEEDIAKPMSIQQVLQYVIYN